MYIEGIVLVECAKTDTYISRPLRLSKGCFFGINNSTSSVAFTGGSRNDDCGIQPCFSGKRRGWEGGEQACVASGMRRRHQIAALRTMQ